MMISPEGFINKPHYLLIIKDYLDSKGLRYDGPFMNQIKLRAEGKVFSFSEHLKGIIYALLSNQTKWKRIEPKLPQIDKMFFDYDVEKIKATNAEYFYNGLFELKCGNVSTKAQMKSLHENIALLEKLKKEFGSLDVFVTSAPTHEIVRKISDSNSPYKLKMFGEALAWEYLRNVGIDGAKPDTHLRRFLGADRLGNGMNSVASVSEVIDQIEILSFETGLSKLEIDNLIWSFCADGYGEQCTSNPKCSECVIQRECKHV